MKTKLVELEGNIATLGGIDGFEAFRLKLADCALSPWNGKLMRMMDRPIEGQHSWALVAMANDGSVKTTLEYWESASADADMVLPTGKLRFEDWLSVWCPQSRVEFLMVFPLYHYYKLGGVVPLPESHELQHPWLNAFLAATRGLLVWRSQLNELIRIATESSWKTAVDLARGFALKRPEALNALSSTRFLDTKSSLLDVIEAHSLPDWGHGSPDYLFGEWLFNWWHDTLPPISCGTNATCKASEADNTF